MIKPVIKAIGTHLERFAQVKKNLENMQDQRVKITKSKVHLFRKAELVSAAYKMRNPIQADHIATG
jgi:uncharacterized protein (UPF0216 family)